MNLLKLKNKAKDKKHITSFCPKNLLDIIGIKKKILYKGINLKTAYLIDIVHILIRRSYIYDRTTHNLDSRILKEKYGEHYNYYINYLIDNKIIELQSNYCVGKKTKTYRVPDISFVGIKNIKNKDNVLLKKYRRIFTINKLKEMNYKHIDLDLMIKIVENLDRVRLDYVSAEEYINSIKLTKKQRIKNEHSIKSLKHDDMWYSFDKYGRFHSNLTTLKSEIRNRFLLIDNEPTVEIDITNSQPIFLTHLMSNHLENVDIEEYEFFKQLVINGQLYPYMIKHTNYTDKKEIKKLIYTVLFGTNHGGKTENKIFKKLFPSIYEFIKFYKKEKNNYRSLSYELQRSESNLLFNNIIKKILEKYPDLPFFTVHDSITVKMSDFDKVKDIFYTEINNIHEKL